MKTVITILLSSFLTFSVAQAFSPEQAIEAAIEQIQQQQKQKPGLPSDNTGQSKNGIPTPDCTQLNSGCYTGWASGCFFVNGQIAYCILQ